jgi:hypothetical protein
MVSNPRLGRNVAENRAEARPRGADPHPPRGKDLNRSKYACCARNAPFQKQCSILNVELSFIVSFIILVQFSSWNRHSLFRSILHSVIVSTRAVTEMASSDQIASVPDRHTCDLVGYGHSRVTKARQGSLTRTPLQGK